MSALTDTFTAIANAIRGKLGVQTTYTPTQMSSAIASIPIQKPEQTKSVTATTSQQTVSPDSGKVLSSVTVNPQVHSATYTPTGYSNANDMGAQNNYRYVDTSGYEPTIVNLLSDADDYTVTDGEIYQINKMAPYSINTKIVADVKPITPSDASPQLMYGNYVYMPDDDGYLIENQPTSITPSNSSPVFLATDGIYKTSSSGYAISSYATKTPSDTSPASVSISSPIQPTSAGYLYKSQHVSQITASMMGGCQASTTYTKMTLAASNNAFYDKNYFSLSSGELTVKRAFSGYLYAYASSGRNSSGTTIYGYCQVRKNGTSVLAVNTDSSQGEVSSNMSISLAVGDKISVYSRISTGSVGAFTKWAFALKTVAN